MTIPLSPAARASESALRVAAQVVDAATTRTPLRIHAAGNWLDAGAPVMAEDHLSVGTEAGVVEYVPGDLTLTVLAGTPLSQIASLCASENQWLPLDPPGSPAGTIGATVATGSYGPLAHSFGTPRDQVLGVEFVTGTGEIVRGGGRVTKNVAGFDLTRLMCGAWGTLGVLTELTLRLRGTPEADVTRVIQTPDSDVAISELLRQLRASGISPTALELLDGAWCRSLDFALPSALFIRFCGNVAGVQAQLSRLAGFTASEECAPAVWTRLQELEPPDDFCVRLSTRPSMLPTLWHFVVRLLARHQGGRARASVGRGVVRLAIPSPDPTAIASALSQPAYANLIPERLPAGLWPAVAPPDVLHDQLTTGIRAAFDPYRILNPGILGE